MSGVKSDRTLRPVGPGEVQVARALLSVSDKTGILEFAAFERTESWLVANGY